MGSSKKHKEKDKDRDRERRREKDRKHREKDRDRDSDKEKKRKEDRSREKRSRTTEEEVDRVEKKKVKRGEYDDLYEYAVEKSAREDRSNGMIKLTIVLFNELEITLWSDMTATYM